MKPLFGPGTKELTEDEKLDILLSIDEAEQDEEDGDFYIDDNGESFYI
ncbi:MAG: hypothetical protein LBM03_01240 [Erysipelotrichaceae bacterium]|jgi:hypothetical protein|nr:hypothetical protein [Erysipelotrichaceae bacterium]